VKGDYWVLNATYLFKALLPVLFGKDESIEKGAGETRVQTLSEGIGSLLESLSYSQKSKESILFTLDEELQKGYASVSSPARKSRTRATKGLLRFIGRFFRHAGELVRKGARKVIRVLKKLFRWFKNAAQVIWRELKKIFSIMTLALRFFFSKRTITTTIDGQSIVTDFDGGFDSVTVISAGARPLIEAHIRNSEAHSKALTGASGFAGMIISIAIKSLTGPCGWIRLGMEVIKQICSQTISIPYF